MRQDGLWLTKALLESVFVSFWYAICKKSQNYFKNLTFTHDFRIFVSFQISRTRLGTLSLEIVSYNHLYGSMS